MQQRRPATMPDLTRDEIEGLAAGLSEAMRLALLDAYESTLTPLGIQVRTLLQEQSNG